MNYALRTKPKGYNTKAWLACFSKAKSDREWAFEIVKDSTWTNSASQMSLEHLGDCLSRQVSKRAKDIYDYLYMRAHGQTFMGALDASAREKWETISEKRVLIKNTWKYDHTNNTTSATYVNKKWIHFFTGKEIKAG